MLTEQTLEKLSAMKLHGMANYLRGWLEKAPDKEKLSTRLQHAKLRQQACLEEIDYGHARGLTKAQVLELSTSKWVESR